MSTIDSVSESQLKSDYRRPWLIDNGFTMYFMISNPSDTPQSFCLAVQQKTIP
ncbi:MAG: hypothetical protein WCL02_06570 [bacterium]